MTSIYRKNICIEFNGKQHYEPVMEFGGVERFRQQIENDKIKRSLAREYKIPLIEINYKNFEKLTLEKFEELVLKTIQRYKKSYD